MKEQLIVKELRAKFERKPTNSIGICIPAKKKSKDVEINNLKSIWLRIFPLCELTRENIAKFFLKDIAFKSCSAQ